MKHASEESHSALLDDELGRGELQEALEDVCRDVNHRRRVERYTLIGHALRDEMPQTLDLDISQRIMQAIEAEASPLGSSRSRSRFQWTLPSFRPWAAGTAVVAVTTVAIGLYQWQTEAPQAVMTASQPVASVPQVAMSPVLPEQDTPEVDVNPYLVNHMGHAASGQFGAVHPYARITAYQDE